MELSAIALQGMERAQAQLERSAERLSRAGRPPSDGVPADTVDLSAEMVGLLSARNAFAAMTRVLKTTDDMERHVIDLLG